MSQLKQESKHLLSILLRPAFNLISQLLTKFLPYTNRSEMDFKIYLFRSDNY